MRNAPALGAVPVVVLTGTQRNMLERGKFAQMWYALQDEIATTYHAEHLIAAHSGHYIQLDQPELVVSAVSRVVAQVAAHQSLRPANSP